MTAQPLPADIVSAIYDILIREAGASPDPLRRAAFTHHLGRGCLEYRFGGRLGFGGKFWNQPGRWYVTQYPEDATPESRWIIERTDAALEELRAR